VFERTVARRRRPAVEAAPPATSSGRAAAAAALLIVMAAGALLPGRAAAQSAWARGDRAFRAGHYAAAESLYTLRLEDRRAPAEVRVNRATARALAGHRPEGVHELEPLAQRHDHAGHEAGYNLGTLLGDAKQYDPALAALRRTLENNPSDQDARWNYEVILQRKDREQQQQQKKPEPQKPKPQPSPSQPGQSPQQNPQPNAGQAPPSQSPQPSQQQQAQKPSQSMDRAQAEQILDALQELQRMDQQRQHKVRVLKERRGRDW
jgi:tetratricopeptide (TPR) repeat protein